MVKWLDQSRPPHQGTDGLDLARIKNGEMKGGPSSLLSSSAKNDEGPNQRKKKNSSEYLDLASDSGSSSNGSQFEQQLQKQPSFPLQLLQRRRNTNSGSGTEDLPESPSERRKRSGSWPS